MKFQIIDNTVGLFKDDTLYLKYIHYDDYGYCTSYRAYVKSTSNYYTLTDLGMIKIGCMSLNEKVEPGTSQNGFNSYSIKTLLHGSFSQLGDEFFSLGQSVEFYQSINKCFGESSIELYSKIKDLAYDFNRFKELYKQRESCLYNSLMRDLHYANIEQFHRVTMGDAPLTRYSFGFNYSDNNISFNVDPDSLPPSNIHVLIGRNGVGKTWLLYHMVCRILEAMDIEIHKSASAKYKLNDDFILNNSRIRFAGVIGMSFSVFDDGLSSIKSNFPTLDLQEKLRMEGEFSKIYKYIGLVYSQDDTTENESNKIRNVTIKSIDMLADEFLEILIKISSDHYKKGLYLEMCKYLELDTMFNDNGFIKILEDYFNDNNQKEQVIKFFKLLSSGHMIIVLSLTALCDSIFEKTIVFIDEPETHLHPPLLSTYIRTLSFLLRKRNAVAIIATHSPIILQEVPKNCVTKVGRIKGDMSFVRPQIETFASGTDQLTREIFGYELIKTGFYKLLEDNLKNTFEETITEFNEQVGFLGQIMIQGLLNNKGDDNNEES